MFIQSFDCRSAYSACKRTTLAGSVAKAVAHAAGFVPAVAPGMFASRPIHPGPMALPAWAMDAIRASAESNWLLTKSPTYVCVLVAPRNRARTEDSALE